MARPWGIRAGGSHLRGTPPAGGADAASAGHMQRHRGPAVVEGGHGEGAESCGA